MRKEMLAGARLMEMAAVTAMRTSVTTTAAETERLVVHRRLRRTQGMVTISISMEGRSLAS
jgi:hypothetical protein